MPRLLTLASGLAVVGASAWTALAPHDSALSLLLVAGAVIIGAASWLEAGPSSARELTMIATLAGVAAAGRILFAAIPGVQPVTVIVVATGVALGARAGIAVGGAAALASNFFLGQGPWTPWQMLAWGACGAAGALAARFLRGRIPFALFCCVLGFGFSVLMDLWEWYSFFPHTGSALLVQLSRGLWFDAAHAIGNLVIALAVGPELRRMLERYGRRLHAEVAWA